MAGREQLEHAVLYLDGKVATLTTVLSGLIDALGVRTDPDYDFDKFAAELMKKLPQGYTKRDAAFNDGKRDALRGLSQIMRERQRRRD